MWRIDIGSRAEKDLKSLDKRLAAHILRRFESRVLSQSDPTLYAKPLQYEFTGLFRLRVEDYRVIFRVLHETKTIQITRIAHRRDAYDD